MVKNHILKLIMALSKLNLHNLEAHQARIALNYFKLVLKLKKTVANIEFNRECKKHNLIPKYINLSTKLKTLAASKTIKHAKTFWLNTEIQILYAKKSNIIDELKTITNNLNQNFNPATKQLIIDNINTIISEIIDKKRATNRKKIKNLIKNQHNYIIKPSKKPTFAPRIYNLSDEKFSKSQIKFLENNCKTNFTKPISNDQLLLECETTIMQTNNEDRNKIRHELVNKSNNICQNNQINIKENKHNSHMLKNINKQLKEKDLSLVNVDKSKSVAIINNRTLKLKVNKFIEENEIQQLDKDPTTQYTKDINKLIDDCNQIINPTIANKLKYSIPNKKQHNLNASKAPKFKPYLKMHKPNNPIRPLVNAIGSPSYKLAKHVDKIIKNAIPINNNYNVKNSKQFAEKIKGRKLKNGELMISLDIVNLYSNIPIEDAIKALKTALNKSGKLSKAEIEQIIKCVETILKQDYFEYDSKFYSTNKGVAMGAPLSSTVSQIYLNSLEETHIMNPINPYFKNIIKYYRYVDDTFLIIRGTRRLINMLLNYVNSISSTIKFTCEIMENNSINFLDLTLYLDIDREICMKIYRKPTFSDTIIPYHSNHPVVHKHAAFHAMAARLYSIPMKYEDQLTEINTIRDIGTNNGYPVHIINNIINKHKNKNKNNNNNYTPEQKPPNNDKFVTLTFYNKASYKIANIFKTKGYKTAFKTNSKLTDNIKNSIPNNPNNKFNTSGVYKINCSSCEAQYIGKTDRSFTTRFQEHLNNNKSNIYKHLKDENHKIDNIDNNLSILHKCKDKRLINALEKYEIVKAKKQSQLLNIQIEVEAANSNVLINHCHQLSEATTTATEQ